MTRFPTLQLLISVILFTFILSVLWTQTNITKLTIYTQNGEKSFYVELAESLFEKYLGLSGRETLNQDRGMLFIYEDESRPVFWMKDTLIPLDIIFIGSNRKIVAIADNVPPCLEEDDSKCLTYKSGPMSQYVLELAGGSSDKYGIRKGDSLEFPARL